MLLIIMKSNYRGGFLFMFISITPLDPEQDKASAVDEQHSD